jgi:hypothetical protein
LKPGRLAAVLAIVVLTACSCAAHDSAPSASPSPLPVATGDYPTYGHAADFSWIAGRVERSLTCAYLRFSDRGRGAWGGYIALSGSDQQMGALQAGDTIVIKGELLRLAYGTCGSPSYAIVSIEEH